MGEVEVLIEGEMVGRIVREVPDVCNRVEGPIYVLQKGKARLL